MSIWPFPTAPIESDGVPPPPPPEPTYADMVEELGEALF